jgi:hypothetical protein
MVTYKGLNNTVGIGPDWVRMNWRYEVTNGANEATSTNLEMRAMSYAMMLGNLP